MKSGDATSPSSAIFPIFYVLCWPKNGVEGCVIEKTTHATFYHVSLATRGPSVHRASYVPDYERKSERRRRRRRRHDAGSSRRGARKSPGLRYCTGTRPSHIGRTPDSRIGVEPYTSLEKTNVTTRTRARHNKFIYERLREHRLIVPSTEKYA